MLEHLRRTGPAQLGGAIGACRDGHDARTDGTAAGHVIRRIADDDDVGPGERPAGVAGCGADGNA